MSTPKERATLAIEAIQRGWDCPHGISVIAQAIEEAVKEEREACEGIVAKEYNIFGADKSVDYRDGWYFCARSIATQIRARSEQGKEE